MSDPQLPEVPPTPEPHSGSAEPTANPPGRPLWEIQQETGVVLVLGVFAYLGYAVLSLIWPYNAAHRPFTEYFFTTLVATAQIAIPVLYLIGRSGEPWSTFGLVPLRWLVDVSVGVATLAAGYLAYLTVWVLLVHWLGPSFGDPGTGPTLHAEPVGVKERLLLIAFCCTNAFGEELVLRGYLIPRFELLLSSTTKSLLFTTFLFASYHIYQGPLGFVSAGVLGLVYGAAFCWLRRLWPLVLAHALQNFIVLSRMTG